MGTESLIRRIQAVEERNAQLHSELQLMHLRTGGVVASSSVSSASASSSSGYVQHEHRSEHVQEQEVEQKETKEERRRRRFRNILRIGKGLFNKYQEHKGDIKNIFKRRRRRRFPLREVARRRRRRLVRASPEVSVS